MESINQTFEETFSFTNMETMEEEITFVVTLVKKFLLQKESFLHFFKFIDEEGYLQGVKTDNWRVRVSASGIVFELNKEKTAIDFNFGRCTFYFSDEYGCFALTNHIETIYFLELGSGETALKAFCIFLAECIRTIDNAEIGSIKEYDIIDKFDEMFETTLRYGKDSFKCLPSNGLL